MEETFDHVPGNEKDQLLPMFISEHHCRTSNYFFVIPKVCLTVCVFYFQNLENLKRIYALHLPLETSDTAVR